MTDHQEYRVMFMGGSMDGQEMILDCDCTEDGPCATLEVHSAPLAASGMLAGYSPPPVAQESYRRTRDTLGRGPEWIYILDIP